MELITITLAEVLMMSSLFIIMCIQELALKHTRILLTEILFFRYVYILLDVLCHTSGFTHLSQKMYKNSICLQFYWYMYIKGWHFLNLSILYFLLCVIFSRAVQYNIKIPNYIALNITAISGNYTQKFICHFPSKDNGDYSTFTLIPIL